MFVEGGVERVPGEGGAFDAHGEFADAGEDLQVAEAVLFCFLVELAHHH